MIEIFTSAYIAALILIIGSFSVGFLAGIIWDRIVLWAAGRKKAQKLREQLDAIDGIYAELVKEAREKEQDAE